MMCSSCGKIELIVTYFQINGGKTFSCHLKISLQINHQTLLSKFRTDFQYTTRAFSLSPSLLLGNFVCRIASKYDYLYPTNKTNKMVQLQNKTILQHTESIWMFIRIDLCKEDVITETPIYSRSEFCISIARKAVRSLNSSNIRQFWELFEMNDFAGKMLALRVSWRRCRLFGSWSR